MIRPRPRAVMVGLAAVVVALAPTVLPGSTASASSPPSTGLPTGLSRLLADGTPSGRAIATFSSTPRSADVSALKHLGLTVQPMHKLPLALVKGPVSAMKSAVTSGVANDVYPDERIKLLDTKSSNAMGSAALRAASTAASTCASASRAWSRKALPAGVSSTPRTLRDSNSAPT